MDTTITCVCTCAHLHGGLKLMEAVFLHHSHWPWIIPIQLDWLVCELQGCFYLCLPSIGIIGLWKHARVLWCWGIELRSSCWCVFVCAHVCGVSDMFYFLWFCHLVQMGLVILVYLPTTVSGTTSQFPWPSRASISGILQRDGISVNL